MDELLKAITTRFAGMRNYDILVVAVELLLIGLVVWLVMRFLRGANSALGPVPRGSG